MSRKDYLVDVRIYNNNLHQAIKSLGFTSVPKFCEAHNLKYGDVNKLLAMKLSPLSTSGKIRSVVVRLLAIFNKQLDELFSDQQMEALDSNRTQREVDAETVFAMMHDSTRLEMSPEEVLLEGTTSDLVHAAMSDLTPREQGVIKMRFGIGGPEMTLEQIGKVYDVGAQRILQIQAKALRKLRYPGRCGHLMELMFDDSSCVDERNQYVIAQTAKVAAEAAKVPEPPLVIRNVKGPTWDLRQPH